MEVTKLRMSGATTSQVDSYLLHSFIMQKLEKPLYATFNWALGYAASQLLQRFFLRQRPLGILGLLQRL